MQVQKNSIFKIEKNIKSAKIFDMRHRKTKIGFQLEVAFFFSKLFPTQILHKIQVCAIARKEKTPLRLEILHTHMKKYFHFKIFHFGFWSFYPTFKPT
jgi:hypothetical protein